MYYSAISILAAIILVIENQDVMRNRNRAFSKPAWAVYRRFLTIVFVHYVTDILWGILENLKLAVPLFINTSVYFVAMAVGVLAWTHYVVTYLEEEKTVFGRIILYFGRIFAGAVCALVIVNIFTPLLFTVNAQSEYTALPVRHAVLMIQIAILILISIYTFSAILRGHTEKRNKYRTLALFALMMAAFLIAQLFYPYLPFYGAAYLVGTCVLHAFVVGDEKEQFRKELEQSKKINALKSSLTSLFNNMPVMTYSKDVESEVYLACNQAFVEYAGKVKSEEVVGKTDAELFDAQTAARFVEDDKKALAWSKPYILYEDVADAAGTPHRLETTKLRFTDEAGRECLLSMSLDISDIERMRLENEQTKEAYEEVLHASAVYENIVNALSKEYFNLYYVDLTDDSFIEYGSKTQNGYCENGKRGENFFELTKTDIDNIVFEQDRAELLASLEKETLLKEIEEHGIFTAYYRLMIDGEPAYASLKATRIFGDEAHIIIGITNVDTQMKDHMEAEQAREERKAYVRLNAFNRNLIALYVVDPENDSYTEFESTEDFRKLGIEKQGEAFFETTHKNSFDTVCHEDLAYFHERFTKEDILQTIRLDGLFVMDYRLMIDGEPKYVRLKAAEVEEDGKAMLIIGVEDIDARVKKQIQQDYDLSVARKQATTDALTGVKNKLVFDDTQKEIDALIAAHKAPPFAVVVCDINNLKQVNDIYGHRQGDEHIRAACMSVCHIFRHSPVFRIGGDEFAVICRGHDYEKREELLAEMDALNREHTTDKQVQLAYGLACFEASDGSTRDVFERADKRMYAHKADLKATV